MAETRKVVIRVRIHNPLDSIRFALRTAILWAMGDDEEEEDNERPDFDTIERDAAYLTTGLITAVRSVNKAHDAGEDCGTHHAALVGMLNQIQNPIIAIRVIQHLLDIVSSKVDDEDVQRMVLSIVATELEDDEDDESFDI